MYLIEKLKMFFGKLLFANDHSEFKVVSECSLMLRKKDPSEKACSLSLSSCCERKDFKTSCGFVLVILNISRRTRVPPQGIHGIIQ